MKRRRSRNPRFTRRQYAVAAAVGGIGAIALYWRLRKSKSHGGMKIFPATLSIPTSGGPDQTPAPEEDKTRSYAASVTVKVSKFGDTYHVVMHQVHAGDDFDIVIEMTITHYLKYNKMYGAPMHEFCRGVVLRGHVQSDGHAIHLSNLEVEDAPLLCGDNELTIPWPGPGSGYGDLMPVAKLDSDGSDLVISIEAPPLIYADETPSSSGESTAWWDHHTQPHGYDMLVTTAVTETKA